MKAALVIFAFVVPAQAAVLEVGSGTAFSLPSAAIAAAKPGDTVHIAAGSYRDCAAWTVDDLTIEGENGTVLREAICQGAGIFVVNAPNAIIRNISFEGASIAEGNGSGIRANGQRLLVEHCSFRNNQDGILTANNGGAELIVRDSRFEKNGACLPNKGCAHGIYAGVITRLRVETSHFRDAVAGHYIKSRARRTEVIGNRIEDGDSGRSSYLIDLPNGGALEMTGNTLQKGPRTENPTAAVILGEEGDKRPAGPVTISDNIFRNDGPPTIFVRNDAKSPALLSGNKITGKVRLLVGRGAVD
ncbi:hypothetical protein FHS83_000045 [Rhizomicrobium palustre]|uniref:Right handed beta helix domain-containing protein n=1 Tax=Rhizomicrobium palustre TaxID=189966 RepID=A0A846MUP0_9PROT|nr:right-handed parallel beta-helix repeat-containing protein [Rhizomicrobium palustre]NIK86727.1 hypothetical protein [Rhizomicrobium palustre]